MTRRAGIAARAACLIIVLSFLPTALMGGVCLMPKHHRADGSKGPVITQDVCGAKVPGAVSVPSYTAALSQSMPPNPIPEVSTTPPTPAEAFAQAETGDTDKPPQASVRA